MPLQTAKFRYSETIKDNSVIIPKKKVMSSDSVISPSRIYSKYSKTFIPKVAGFMLSISKLQISIQWNLPEALRAATEKCKHLAYN